jgi:hypothetical protein
MAQSRPNFFILLDIEPIQPWSESFFESRLDEKRAEWTKKGKNPKNRLTYDGYMRLVPQIKAVMSNEEERKKEADEAILQRTQAQQKLHEDLRETLNLLLGKGYITEDEIANLVKSDPSKPTEADIRSELKKQNAEIRKNASSVGEQGDVIENSEMERIKKNLEILDKKDLYDFLGTSFVSRTSDLRLHAEDIYKQNQAKADKSPQVTASSELAGDAQKHFKDEAARARYDRSLARDQLEVILGKQVKKIIETSSDKLIRAKQFDRLLEIARSQKLDIERATDFIRERAFQMKASVEVATSSIEQIKQKLLCTNPACRKVNESSNKACTNCGTPLKINCPSCGTLSPVEYIACPTCSFPIGNVFNVRSLIAESQQLIIANEYNNASEYLELASQEWSSIPPRTLNDELTKQINQLQLDVKNYQNRKSTLSALLETAIDERRFYEARILLRQFETEFKVVTSKYEREKYEKINMAVSEAETELLKAREVEIRSGDAVELYQNILWKCKDCKGALDALAKIPPAPPSGLSASIGNKVVSLSWNSSPAKNVRYTVVRKYGSFPVSASDGEQLATVVGTVYEDTKPSIGIPVFYAVYTNRENILSVSAALLNKHILLIEEVSNVITQVSNKQVTISWQAPQYAQDILVFRTTQPQINARNGQQIQVISQSKSIDVDLENAKTYYYTIYALFRDHDAKNIYSQGVSIQAIPEEPPSIIENLQIELEDLPSQKRLRLSWQTPNKGEVAILSSSSYPAITKGSIFAESNISSLGKLLLSNNSKNEIFIPVSETEMFYFTPIVLFQKMAYIGEIIEYVNIEDVTGLKCQKQRDELRLQWDWKPGCQQVIVSYGHEGFPSNQSNNNFNRTNVTKTQYELLGYYPIKNILEKDYYICVFNTKVKNGKTIVASGLSNSARYQMSLTSDINIQYIIKRKRKLFGKNEVSLEITAVGKGEVPELTLISKKSAAPLNKGNGTIVLSIPKFTLTSQNQTTSYNIDEQRQSYGKLFLANDNLYKSRGGYVRIDHPSLENMEIFTR